MKRGNSRKDGVVISLPSYAIFDLDGTLVDSQEGILHSFHATLGESGLSRSDEELRELIGPPLNESFAKLGFADRELDEVLDRYREYYAASGVTMCRLYDGIAQMLSRFRSSHIRLGVATAKRVDFAQQMIDSLGVAPYFEVVEGASVDGVITSKKEIVARVLEHFQPDDPRDVWMLGDRQYDVQASIFHGLTPVGVLWGYGSRAELTSSGAALVVAHPSELLSYEEESEGGDPVCWIHLTCPTCGVMQGGTHRLAQCLTTESS